MSLPGGPEAAVLLLLLVVALLLMAMVVVHRRNSARYLPMLSQVGDLSTGVLACPVCRGTSFQSPPGGGGGFFALALGPFVFGSLSTRGVGVAECVVCATQYARGAYVPAVSADSTAS